MLISFVMWMLFIIEYSIPPRSFASEDLAAAFNSDEQGIAWDTAKQRVIDIVDRKKGIMVPPSNLEGQNPVFFMLPSIWDKRHLSGVLS